MSHTNPNRLTRALHAVEVESHLPGPWVELALAFLEQGKVDGGYSAAQQAVRLGPADPRAWGAQGLALRRMGRLAESLAAFRQAASLDPEDGEAQSNLAACALAAGDYETALHASMQAFRLSPHVPTTLANHANVLRSVGRFPEALSAIESAIALSPNNPRFTWNRALIHLAAGENRLGWKDYEARLLTKRTHLPSGIPWDGEPFSGTLQIHIEQGIGDSLQFARFVVRARQRVGRVELVGPGRLRSLLGGIPGADAYLDRETPMGAAHRYCAMASLPAVLAEDGSTIAEGAIWLRPDATKKQAWVSRLARNGSGLKVGLCWQGNPSYEADHLRSPGIANLKPLSDLRSVRLFSLQKVHGLQELRAGRAPFPIEDLDPELDQGDQVMADSVSCISAMDLVITSDTATAHLAGSIGVPTWIALSWSPDWRWGVHGKVCPWYPTVRLWRQPEPGAWEPVFSEMVRTLNEKDGLP